MAVDSSNAVSQSQIISSTSKTTNTKKSNTLNMENFLSLLVAEMQNQDPLEPTSNSDYMAQMATFSQVEATTEMNEKVLSQTASNLIGKAVIVKTDMNTSGYAGGVVNGWQEIDGIIYLGINGGLYDINDVDQVIDKDYYEKWRLGEMTATKCMEILNLKRSTFYKLVKIYEKEIYNNRENEYIQKTIGGRNHG